MTATADDRARLLAMLTALPRDPTAAAEAFLGSNDLRRTLAYAFRHGVLPYVACHLGPLAPAPLRPMLRDAEETRALSHAVSLRALQHALQALAALSVEVLALKGPLLSARLYDPPFARPSLDLDLLVRERDFANARRALHQASWRDAPGTDAATSLARHHHVQLVSEIYPSIELHFAATSSFGTRIEADSLFARARTVDLDGLAALVPGESDEIAYLATHAAAHHVERLGWLYDLALLLRRGPEVDSILTRASELGVRRVTHAMLALASCSFGVHAALPPLDAIQRAALATVAAVEERAGSTLARSVARVGFISALADSPRHSVSHAQRKAGMWWQRMRKPARLGRT